MATWTDEGTGQHGEEERSTSAMTGEEDVATLRDMLKELQLQQQHAVSELEARLRRADQERVTIVTQPPLMIPKAKIFTGLPPASPQEVTFAEWYPLMRDALRNEAVPNKTAFIRQHLRGPALQHVSSLPTTDAASILEQLNCLFGTLKSSEDAFIDLCQARPKSGQKLADHLLEVFSKLKDLQATARYSEEDFSRKLYLAFSKSCTGLTALELINKFGIPGEGAPTFADLFKALRQMEVFDLQPERKRGSQTEAVVHAAQTAAPGGRGTQEPAPAKRTKRPCFKCGLEGHFYRDCQNPPNPRLVAERDKERRRQNNEWRRRKGLPEIPLN